MFRQKLFFLILFCLISPTSLFAEIKGSAHSFEQCVWKSCCENMATSCLMNCSGVGTDTDTYNQCVIQCDRRRSRCMRRMAIQPKSPPAVNNTVLPPKTSD